MHDAADIAKGGEKGARSQDHSWFVFDHNYCGPSKTIRIDQRIPTAQMPWQTTPRATMLPDHPTEAVDRTVLLGEAPGSVPIATKLA